ncbi:MAG: hypothetical protein HKN13_10025, partial [Rhodothermales bacterium]|nr:hypothetical protein [Rhodothermales bacterium]
MDRKKFLQMGLAGGIGTFALAGTGSFAGCGQSRNAGSTISASGLDLAALAADYRSQLFDEYLPFWEKGGIDDELGGFMCYLHDDGSVQDDRKD